MKNKTGIKLVIIIILIICLAVLCYYLFGNTNKASDNETTNSSSTSEANNLEKPENEGPSGNSGKLDANGKTTISDEQTLENKEYESSDSDENALLIDDGGDVTLKESKITKTGDSTDENADFYGTNAGILVDDGGKLDSSNLEITTDAEHANGFFVYGTGSGSISDSTIKTSGNTSGGIMVAGGGTLNAENLEVETEGNSSAAIRSDRGGGTLNVTKGSYTTNGVGSPSIYSTADITVKDATLTSNKSEGAVVEGNNSITLENCDLTDTNTELNGNSETYKNIFLYQSMSGDAEEGEAEFTAKDSSITTNKGDTIFVTNTTATINLENNTIVNDDGDFLRIQAGKWGKSGSNGGDVTLNLTNQKVSGNIIVDDISTLAMNLKSGSEYSGTINGENKAKEIKLVLDSDSKITLTGDSYVTSLEDEAEDYSNINFNGYKLYVNGEAIN